MKPYLHYLGVILIALLLAFAFHNGAHGEERQPDPECLLALTPDAMTIYARNAAGVTPEMNRYLILSDRSLMPQGRWVLLRVLEVVLVSQHPATPIAALSYLCAIPDPPGVAGIDRSEFDKLPEDI